MTAKRKGRPPIQLRDSAGVWSLRSRTRVRKVVDYTRNVDLEHLLGIRFQIQGQFPCWAWRRLGDIPVDPRLVPPVVDPVESHSMEPCTIRVLYVGEDSCWCWVAWASGTGRIPFGMLKSHRMDPRIREMVWGRKGNTLHR